MKSIASVSDLLDINNEISMCQKKVVRLTARLDQSKELEAKMILEQEAPAQEIEAPKSPKGKRKRVAEKETKEETPKLTEEEKGLILTEKNKKSIEVS